MKSSLCRKKEYKPFKRQPSIFIFIMYIKRKVIPSLPFSFHNYIQDQVSTKPFDLTYFLASSTKKTKNQKLQVLFLVLYD